VDATHLHHPPDLEVLRLLLEAGLLLLQHLVEANGVLHAGRVGPKPLEGPLPSGLNLGSLDIKRHALHPNGSLEP
jgi:hypothetical protein